MSEKARVVLYSKPECHLCDEALEQIQASGCMDRIMLQKVDIRENPELFEQYRFEIPVITINGIKAFKFRLTADEFRRKLKRIAGV